MGLTLDIDDTRQRIHELVQGGFHEDDDIEWMITDEYLDPDDLNEEDVAWVRQEAARAWTRNGMAPPARVSRSSSGSGASAACSRAECKTTALPRMNAMAI